VTGLTANQLARVDGLLDELLDLPAESRTSVLDRKCTDDPEDIPPGTRIGAWRILRRIGRDGVGVVYEAERDPAAFVSNARERVR